MVVKNKDKMVIVLDREKIIQAGQYDPDELERYIEGVFAKLGISKDHQGVYINGGFTSFMVVLMILQDIDWFINYVKEWKWYKLCSNTDYPCEDDYKYEDLLLEFKELKWNT